MASNDMAEVFRLEAEVWRLKFIKESHQRASEAQIHAETEARSMALIAELQAELERAVLDEREACARLCEDLPMGRSDSMRKCAAAIRARGGSDE